MTIPVAAENDEQMSNFPETIELIKRLEIENDFRMEELRRKMKSHNIKDYEQEVMERCHYKKKGLWWKRSWLYEFYESWFPDRKLWFEIRRNQDKEIKAAKVKA